MMKRSIRNIFSATAFAALLAIAGAFPAAASEVVYDDFYFDSAKGFADDTGTPIEEASVPSHIWDAMEIE